MSWLHAVTAFYLHRTESGVPDRRLLPGRPSTIRQHPAFSWMEPQGIPMSVWNGRVR